VKVQPDPGVGRRLRTAYGLAAGRYARWVAPSFRPLARELLALPRPPADPGLDVGSGTGAALAEWRRLVPGASLLAVDLTAEMLYRSTATWRAAADAAALPLLDASFRTVISVFALHHLPDPGAALREWGRVLASGGELRLATWGESAPTLWDTFDHALADLGLSEAPRLAGVPASSPSTSPNAWPSSPSETSPPSGAGERPSRARRGCWPSYLRRDGQRCAAPWPGGWPPGPGRWSLGTRCSSCALAGHRRASGARTEARRASRRANPPQAAPTARIILGADHTFGQGDDACHPGRARCRGEHHWCCSCPSR
jgi:SAM-dependent methyltransferase